MLRQFAERAEAIGRDLLDFFHEPSSLFQMAVVAVCFILATIFDRLSRGAIEDQARRIKGAPRVLRLVAAIRRRMRLVYFVLLVWMASLVDAAAGGPASEIIAVVLKLALAFLVIAVASRIIRNRLLARLITLVAWTFAALSILHWLEPVAVTLDGAAVTFGATRISLLLAIKTVALLAGTLWLASVIGQFLDARVRRSEELTPTLRVLIGKFLRIGLILLSLTVALAVAGVDLTALTVLSGAIGVGLGFGLQKVVSNFISGIIILLDRSIKPGDTISLGETFGWIRELRARFVSVVTRDGREFLIPNEDFITNQVINWSFTNELVRIDVKFGVAYDSDPHAVIALAKAAVASVPRVVEANPVVCWITGFGDSSIDFVLRFWIRDPQAGLTNVKGAVFLALWDAFKANGVTLPFPQRDVTLYDARMPKPRAEEAPGGPAPAFAGDAPPVGAND
ncbi:mechanosensitive ion channel family protein [Aureimonas glaciei]|uniref:Mechanosensitive ion channel protein n=1 Tax=Aureimonas glaciei TaxID=1776957 RepID=A0A916Y232_9HYPH|nr:mechanosensitive ion channel domain-containing protein [Aureimonas glaciei]GGD27213.1 mechanosensitive ion channel protein [Aureimonas glaciei]